VWPPSKHRSDPSLGGARNCARTRYRALHGIGHFSTFGTAPLLDLDLLAAPASNQTLRPFDAFEPTPRPSMGTRCGRVDTFCDPR
jgi:hypothetical protein